MNTSAWKYQDGATAGGHADDLFQELDRWNQEAGGWASAPIGSLVFFGRTEDNSHGHVGIYVGGGEIIHAWGRVKTNEIQGMLDGAEAGTEGYEGIGPYVGWAYPPERWRPVERRVVYFSNHGENAEIWKMDSDGSNGVRLTTAPESDWDPDWSPDGDTILSSPGVTAMQRSTL
jgi:cell wall-associated NlpC family hydrolase